MVMAANIVTGKYIRDLREEHGFSQAELAELAGISQAHIAKIESEKVDPRLSTVNRIMSILSVRDRKITCRDVMTRNIISVHADDPLEKVIGIMRQFAISQVPVLHGKMIVGSLRDSSIVRNVHRNPKNLKVKDIMEEPFPVVNTSDSVEMPTAMLDFHQAVIVSENGKPMGIITKSDLLNL